MDINDYEIRSGRIIGEDKNEMGENIVYNEADLLMGTKTAVGTAKIEDYEIHSGRVIGEDKDESGRNKIHNIVDLLSGDTPTPSDLGSLAYKDSASGDYTPQGDISQPTFTGSQATITVSGTPTGNISKPTVQFIPTSKNYIMTTVKGSLPTITYNSEKESLTSDAGTLPTTENKDVLIGGECQVNTA
ncbi:MAG: hypothetical protein IJ736_05905, partial [Firmicutes bacterium]|nr:hypothetical protein [Bacillota bacterium]